MYDGYQYWRIHKNVTEDTRKEYPQIPWRAIAGMRDIAAHKYQTLRMEDVYYTVHIDFPTLKEQLNNLIEIN
ncbi:HepT-like ribonuclease domain-containing protein [Parablautia muri]|uniref:HepT-like ribonuclease domain-containing protein n=1 Tax=Parablautia muri TaxID=2320879 RepID=UPI002412B5C0|nr:HepT-like ribonuclease domain-containing protein [Parablautia muri]